VIEPAGILITLACPALAYLLIWGLDRVCKVAG
jgi:hypothetical protein